MAESILFDLAGNIITKLGSLALRELVLICGVRGELDKLKDTLSSVKAVLLDAEEQQSNNHQVENWVSNLKDALYDIDDLFDEFSYETLRRQAMGGDRRKRCKQVRIFFSKSNQIGFALKMGHKIKDIMERLKYIDANKNQFCFSKREIDNMRDDELRKARETCSYIPEEEVIGRNDDKKAIIELLLKPNTNTKEDIAIISIIGIGGLGKTALAQSVYNNDMVVNHFELKLWVCVSEEFDVKVIIQNLIESTTGKESKSSNKFELLQSELRRKIDGKKYLIVMDDVWNENYEKWVTLRRSLMGGVKGSRILITTRSEKVAKTFDTTSWYFLQNLDEGNSWLLFKKMTFLEGSGELENSNLIEIGEEIVAKLDGVPLAIRTIGRFLYENKSKDFWLSFKENELHQSIEQRDQLKDKIIPILKLSYNHLPSNLKQCFLYCALFPKDYKIQKDELILQWRAQGFIQPNEKDNFIDIGEDYFMELLSRSFFQDVTKNKLGDIITCKMHDLMHDLACSIVKNEYVSNARTPVLERTHHISLHLTSGENLEEVLLETLSKARNLRTFFMRTHANGTFETRIYNLLPLRALILSHMNPPSVKFLESMSKLKHLRYLSISTSNIEVLPDSITELFNLETLILRNFTSLKELPRDVKNWINLRHLDLFNACRLQFLPGSITHLKKLETLLLCLCGGLKELPGDIKNLIKLKHLDMDGCWNLTHLPKGIGELTNLQTMNLFVVGKNKGGGLSELNGLNKLRGKLVITGLQYCTSIDLQTNAKLFIKSSVQDLMLCWDDYPFKHKPQLGYSNLREMIIYGYKEVTLRSWLLSYSFGCPVSMDLASCKNLQNLSQLDTFPCLKQLILKDLPNIEYIIVNNDSLSSSTRFPSLEKLSIAGTPKLKRWYWKDKTSMESNESIEVSFSIRIIFPCLSELMISDCPLSILIPLHAPNLKSLYISAMGKNDDEFNVVPWKNFENISIFWLFTAYNLEYFPKGLQHLIALQHLSVSYCGSLKSLPEWIANFTSLTVLDIFSCEKLISLPEGIRHLHCLQSLRIMGCRVLKKRCHKDTGEDWPKIAHIQNVILH